MTWLQKTFERDTRVEIRFLGKGSAVLQPVKSAALGGEGDPGGWTMMRPEKDPRAGQQRQYYGD